MSLSFRHSGRRRMELTLRQRLLSRSWTLFDKGMPVLIMTCFLASLSGCANVQTKYVQVPVNVPSELTEPYAPPALPLGRLTQKDVENAYLDVLGLLEKSNLDKLSIRTLLDTTKYKTK
ncbi:Rz1 lytic protein [Pectobacterium phage MA13]|uniref:Rz1 lytic protein n=1 Tax=Pectobacterium phage MA13 TaxID=2662284 RepID=A0A5Q2F7T4_9CAUD|nr:Rz1 lytic protein [Pectobacterium phage MA13]